MEAKVEIATVVEEVAVGLEAREASQEVETAMGGSSISELVVGSGIEVDQTVEEVASAMVAVRATATEEPAVVEEAVHVEDLEEIHGDPEVVIDNKRWCESESQACPFPEESLSEA